MLQKDVVFPNARRGWRLLSQQFEAEVLNVNKVFLLVWQLIGASVFSLAIISAAKEVTMEMNHIYNIKCIL